MKVETAAIETVLPYARNPRKNEAAVAKVAASIKEFGWRQPIVVDSEMVIIAGHTRLGAARMLGMTKVPVHVAKDFTPQQIKAYRLADNRVGQEAEWDADLLRLELLDLESSDFDLSETGFDDDELAALMADVEDGLTDPDAVPEVPDDPATKLGDVWLLGKHRLMCGDSTSIDAVDKLMAGQRAALLHADPPYGMGKEKDGVANDNLYAEKLDAFQMDWWTTMRTVLEDNASAYVWGNAPDLWRLWYRGGLADSERMTFRNEIAWDKGTAQGISAEQFRMFPISTERCLFFMLGEQGFNINADNYWEGWEPIRLYLETEMNKCGGSKSWKEALGNQMGKHYFTKSQWSFPTKEAYDKLQQFAQRDAFKRDYDAFKRDYDELKREFYATRAYFDNAHDNMSEVWGFEKVYGENRHGHATPKPVLMMERVMRSSLPEGGICVEPFGGSGSTLMGAEKTNRICYTMELQPKYCDVIVTRWQEFTGKKATLDADGRSFAAVAKDRNKAAA